MADESNVDEILESQGINRDQLTHSDREALEDEIEP